HLRVVRPADREGPAAGLPARCAVRELQAARGASLTASPAPGGPASSGPASSGTGPGGPGSSGTGSAGPDSAARRPGPEPAGGEDEPRRAARPRRIGVLVITAVTVLALDIGSKA